MPKSAKDAKSKENTSHVKVAAQDIVRTAVSIEEKMKISSVLSVTLRKTN